MLPPGSMIGILGGGQLGRMLAISAARLGLGCHIYCPDSESPAFEVAAAHTVAAYDDPAALEAFAGACDAVTLEFENIPAASLDWLAQHVPVHPGAGSLAVCQDRIAEKTLVSELGLPTAPWHPIHIEDDLAAASALLGRSTLMKTSRLGYDGKGQARIEQYDTHADAWKALGKVPAILEQLIRFRREVSVVAMRDQQGACAAYDVVENEHDNGILRTSRVPARLATATAEAALDYARHIGEALDHVGVFAVEMFVVEASGHEQLLINEIAPRVHNSGHWTIEACPADQFEAHIRCVAGWPLPGTWRAADAEMTNLLGEEADRWREIAAESGSALHLYGKRDMRPGRKMGHVTRLAPLDHFER